MNEDKPIVDLKYEEIKTPDMPSPNIQDQFGLIPTVAATPAHEARKFSEQFRIKSGQLCFYDAANNAWTCLGAVKTYGGLVTSGGSASTPFPSGWTAATTGTGFYTVTHNLGHTNYAVVILAYSTQTRAVNVTSASSTVFAINIKNSAGTDTDNAFYFIVQDMS